MKNDVGIKDVAYLAHVSVSTVSKVLKNYPNISQKTKEKVMKVVQETGYIPNSVASALASKSKKRIALYIYINDRHQQIDEINMLYILGAFSEAREHDLEMVTIFDESVASYTNEECALYFRSLAVDSVIVFGLNKNDERIHYLVNDDERFNVVVIDADVVRDRVSCVMVDHCQGQYDVAKTAVKENDRVLYLAGKEDGYVTEMRLEGMRRLADEMNLDMDVINGEFSEQKAYEIVRDSDKNYDDIICASDLMAIGARRALKDKQTRLTGFDGIRLMSYVAADVMTCRQDFYLIAREAVRAAEKLRAGCKGERIIVPYEITRIG